MQSNGMAKTEERTELLNSADIIRELRGPLPEDDPDMILVDGRYEPRRRAPELSPEQKEAFASVVRDLEALPEGKTLTMDEVLAFTSRLPRRPDGWTAGSAEADDRDR